MGCPKVAHRTPGFRFFFFGVRFTIAGLGAPVLAYSLVMYRLFIGNIHAFFRLHMLVITCRPEAPYNLPGGGEGLPDLPTSEMLVVNAQQVQIGSNSLPPTIL